MRAHNRLGIRRRSSPLQLHQHQTITHQVARQESHVTRTQARVECLGAVVRVACKVCAISVTHAHSPQKTRTPPPPPPPTDTHQQPAAVCQRSRPPSTRSHSTRRLCAQVSALTLHARTHTRQHTCVTTLCRLLCVRERCAVLEATMQRAGLCVCRISVTQCAHNSRVHTIPSPCPRATRRACRLSCAKGTRAD
jgi:hypothetical protein